VSEIKLTLKVNHIWALAYSVGQCRPNEQYNVDPVQFCRLPSSTGIASLWIFFLCL